MSNQMDNAAEEAAHELKGLPDSVVLAIGEWWSAWYLQAGHRRLGRVLLGEYRERFGEEKLSSNEGFHEQRA